VAQDGLLQPRKVETVCRWLARYRAEGVAGLTIRLERGRKPAFSPQQPNAATACATLLDMLRREPRQFGLECTRWRLADLLAQLDGWQLHGPSSLSRLLHRLRISFQQGRHIHSPDRHYQPQQQEVAHGESAAHLAAQEAGWDGWHPLAVVRAPRRQVTVLQGALTYGRQPTLAHALAGFGRDADGQTHLPLAQLSQRSTTKTRVAATRDVISGQLAGASGSGEPNWRRSTRTCVRPTLTLGVFGWCKHHWPVHWHATC
jgi:transposase